MAPIGRKLIVTADDFGLDPSVNAAVEEACEDGILTSASLMVGASAADDAVRRARRLPHLAVGLHVTVVRGEPVCRPDSIPDLVGPDGRLHERFLAPSVAVFARPGVRRQLALEIRAQFEAFRRTGLALDHVDAHCHMQLHPTIGRICIDIGREFGSRAMRVPDEPVVLPGGALATRNVLVRPFVGLLRARLRRAAMISADRLIGIAYAGALDQTRLDAIVRHLPEGITEIHCHPARYRSPKLEREQPGYRGEDELKALRSWRVRELLAEAGVELTNYGTVAAARATAA